MTETTRATVKSPFLSKTNITGVLLGLFGLLVAFHILPTDFDSAGFVGGVVAVGSALVVAFRTFTTSILKT